MTSVLSALNSFFGGRGSEMDEWVLEIRARYNRDIPHASIPSMDNNLEKWPSIFGNWQCWDDFLVTFLPEIQMCHLVACMTHCFGLNVHSYLEYMQQKVDRAWSYYRGLDEQFRAVNSKRFIEHLLVNSCFLIYTMILYSDRDNLQRIFSDQIRSNLPQGLTIADIQNVENILLGVEDSTQSYMLTINCQIPWFVLEAIYRDLSNLSIKLLNTPIHEIALSCFRNLHPTVGIVPGGGTVPEGGFKHLLHIFHWSRTPNGRYLLASLELTTGIGHFYIPSAIELKLSQVSFVANEHGFIDASYINGIFSGVMQLVPCHLFQYSTKLYENLLRFEQGYRAYCGLPFTAYVACMTCLLKTEADVSVLRVNGVIPNTLGLDNKDVLHCVQVLKTKLDDHLFMPIDLDKLAKDVMAHHKKRSTRFYGELKSRYCPNPWITITVIAAILLFAFTCIQTIYSTLSYYNQ